jgi:hypothetical protein
MGFTCGTMLGGILVISASKRVNHASMALGWFGADLVVRLLLVTLFTFWPLLKLGDFPTFLV